MLLTATTLMPFTAQADDVIINETNFPDANFRNFLLSQNYGADGKLTAVEINNITSIFVDRNNLSSLKGIEHFTALIILSCENNQLTTLDVSKNTALIILSCENNQLTTLDVSKNTALTSLFCYNNQLTALDVSKNTALTTLHCSNNQLTALNVSGCTALTTLYCPNNQLIALNVSGCTALTELSCGVNKLATLDVSNNTALTELDCGENQLKALDVSNNTALTGLYCYENQLKALDVSNNTALTELNCYGNQIKKDAMEVLVGSLPQQNAARLIVYDTYGEEGNVCTKDQVAKAKAKGWTSLYSNGLEYEGVDAPDGIEAVKAGEATGANRGSAPVYRANGQRLPKPRKGLNIIGGKKVMVK